MCVQQGQGKPPIGDGPALLVGAQQALDSRQRGAAQEQGATSGDWGTGELMHGVRTTAREREGGRRLLRHAGRMHSGWWVGLTGPIR
jgi:hypothetical protein